MTNAEQIDLSRYPHFMPDHLERMRKTPCKLCGKESKRMNHDLVPGCTHMGNPNAVACPNCIKGYACMACRSMLKRWAEGTIPTGADRANIERRFMIDEDDPPVEDYVHYINFDYDYGPL